MRSRLAIDYDGFRLRQIVLLNNTLLRLDHTKLPIFKLIEPGFINSMSCGRYAHSGLQVLCAIDKMTAKLLAMPMRHAVFAGPSSREAHRHVGWYLAIEFLNDMIDIEQCIIIVFL